MPPIDNGALERAIGTPRFVALYVVGLLASSGVTWWRQRRNPVYASLGASGAILAVLFDPDFELVKAACEAVRRHADEVTPKALRKVFESLVTEEA